MSGGGRRFGRTGRGGGGHRQSVKTTFNNKFNRRDRNNRGEDRDDVDEDTPMQPTIHKVMITGFSHTANTEVLRTFLIGKTSAKFVDFNVNDTKIFATVESKAEALALCNMSGTVFGNKKLHVKLLNSQPQLNKRNANMHGGGRDTKASTTNIRQERKVLESFIARYYDKDERMLNLMNLAAILPNLNSVNFNDRSFTLQLFDIMATACSDILTLVLNRNNISKLSAFASLSKYKLNIINISLDSNNITDFDELTSLKDLHLRELVLSNNPVCAGLDEVSYQLEVVRRLPELGFLDTRKIKQGADNHPITQLPPIQGNFFDAPNRQQLADGFLQKYYEAYDNDRDLLTHAYAEQSCFSISIVSASKPIGRGGSTFRGEKFIPYTSVDRNLITNKSLDTRTSTLKTGPTHIVGTLLDLPQTKHDYESFIVDCFVSSVGSFEMLNIFVHGSFLESTKAKRSFSRVFLLCPPPAGSKPDGWPLVIINDQFYIRHFTPKKVKPPPLPVPVAATPGANTTLDTATMQKMVTQLATITSMTLVFSEQCLVQNNWNYEQALANFQDLRAKNIIPPEAFVK